MPFVKVNCTALQWFLTSALGSKSNPQFFYGRALGRLVAHELYHVAGHTIDHTRIGVTKAAVSVGDLISEQFTFGKAALGKLCPTRSVLENR